MEMQPALSLDYVSYQSAESRISRARLRCRLRNYFANTQANKMTPTTAPAMTPAKIQLPFIPTAHCVIDPNAAANTTISIASLILEGFLYFT